MKNQIRRTDHEGDRIHRKAKYNETEVVGCAILESVTFHYEPQLHGERSIQGSKDADTGDNEEQTLSREITLEH